MMGNIYNKHGDLMRAYPRKCGTVAEVADYIAEQQNKGWPGSISIHGNAISRRNTRTGEVQKP